MTIGASARPPQTTPEALITRAAELRELIRETAAAAEQLGHYTPEVHAAFREAGFYNMFTPKRYGGLEVDMITFARVIMEVGRGDPGTAWCLCLGQGHALTTASFWPEKAQDEVFTNSCGYFRASHSLNPAGTAKRVDGGWLINAKSRYQSGVAYASHATVSVQVIDDDVPAAPPGPPPGMNGAPGPAAPGAPGFPVPGGPGAPDGLSGAPRLAQVLIPEGQFTVLDDWGGDVVFGMRASGSNSIVVDNQVVPESYANLTMLEPAGASTPGTRLHGNPMYLDAARLGFFALELVTPVVGAARAALDEYEKLARTRNTAFPGGGPRYKDPFYQRDFGAARIKADCAEAIVLQVADTIMRWNRMMAEGALVVTLEMDMGLNSMLMEAGELAKDAVELLFCSAGTSASAGGQPMQRYLRDVSMYRTHRVGQYDSAAQRYGAALFGELPPMAF